MLETFFVVLGRSLVSTMSEEPYQSLSSTNKTDDSLSQEKTTMKTMKRRRGDDLGLSCKAVLLDIEGTTTPISFVRDVLFPFVRKNIESYLEDNWSSDLVKDDVEALREQSKKDQEDKELLVKEVPALTTSYEEKEQCLKEVLACVKWQMDNDRKTTALKQLQGHIWKTAYSLGDLKGEIYSDVVPALENWKNGGIQIYIYSSGSVEAQKLLFGHSDRGDLLHFFTDHFDTKTGSKTEKASYERIAKIIKFNTSDILFITDNVKEARAAKDAEMQVILSVRPGNAPLTDDDKMEFKLIHTFNDIFDHDISQKRHIK